MKALARITVLLRRLASIDPSFEKAKIAAETALQTAVREGRISHNDIEQIAALIAADLERMSFVELSAEVRDSLSAMLVSMIGKGAAAYGAIHAIREQLPIET